jgi:hypothetical protein
MQSTVASDSTTTLFTLAPMLTEHTLVPEMLVFAKVVELRALPPHASWG